MRSHNDEITVVTNYQHFFLTQNKIKRNNEKVFLKKKL